MSGTDLSSGSLAGTATVGADGKAIIAVSLANDTLTEGDETMTLEIAGQSDSVTVKDTSLSPVVASSFSLTAGVDNLTGGAGSDTFTGNYQVGTSTTIQAGDSINGGDGEDTLFISAQSAATTAQSLSGVTVSSVENISLSSSSGVDLTVNMSGFKGVTQVGNYGSTGNVIFSGAKGVTSAKMGGDAGNLTVTASALAYSGEADSFTLNLDGVAGNTSGTTGLFTLGDSTSGVVETLTIKSSGNSSTIGLADANDTKTLVFSGDAAVSVASTLDTTVKVVDASAMTAGVTLILPTSDISITGGSGNDVIRGGATITVADTIDAGSGTDALRITSAFTASAAKNLKGFETLSADSLTVATTATTAGYTLTQDAQALAGITTLEVRGIAKTAAVTASTTSTDTLYGGVSFTGAAGTESLNIASGAFNVSGDVKNTATTNSQVVLSVLNATVAASLKTNTAADAITVNLGSSSGSTLGIENNTATLTNSTATGVTGSTATANSVITLSLDDYETVTVNTRAGASTLDTLTSTSLKSLSVTGSKDLTISALTAANVSTVNASDFKGSLNLTSGSSTKAQTILGGSGNDTLSFDTTGRADSVDGGAGNDTIGKADGTGSGNDTMMGGSGNDTIYSGAGNDMIDGGDNDDSIVGASGNDSLVGGSGNDTFAMAYSTALAFDSNDTIDGGDGTDSIQLTGTATTAVSIDLSASTLTNFANVKNIERVQYNISNTSTSTLLVGDVLLGSFNNSLAVTVGTTAATNTNGLSVDASAVLNTNSTITYTGATATATSMTLGNGIDKYTGGTANDTVYVGNTLFLQPTDVLAGGLGADTLSFRTNGTLVLTADKFAGVTSFESFTVANTSTYNGAVKFTLSDAVAVANAASATNSFTVNRTATETGTTTYDGSAVTSVNLALGGAAGADTLVGGALNDTITGGGGADSMTGGAGNDTFIYSASGSASGDVIAGGDGVDTIRFDLATATTDTTIDMTYATLSSIEALSLYRGASSGKTIAQFPTTLLTGATYSVAAVAGTGTGIAQITVSGGSTATSLNFSGLTPANTSSDGSNELVLVYTSTATAGQYITGSGLSDSITGGSAADTIIAGDGSDTITDGAGVDIYYLSDSSAATSVLDTIASATTGGTSIGNLATTATTAGQLTLTVAATTGVVTQKAAAATAASFDLSSSLAAIVYGMASTDVVNLVQAGVTPTAVTSVATAVTLSTDNSAITIRGGYDTATGLFTYSATGADTLLVQDVDATAAINTQAILLIGVSAVTAGTGTVTFSA